MTDILSSKNSGLVAARFVFFILQFVVYEGLNIYIDHRRIHSFRGMDKNEQKIDSKLLDEAEDVKAHQQLV